MDPQIPQVPSSNDLSYQVMPQSGSFQSPKNGVPLAPPMSIQSGSKLPPPPIPQMPSGDDFIPDAPRRSGSKILYIILAILVLAGLAVGAYLLLGTKSQSTETAQTKLPKVWLNQYFGSETCADENSCGDNADPDKDGLANVDEFKEGANPTLNDTDADGLADGDEINIYGTDPNLKYTDRREIVAQNNWTDSIQIKGGYDPLTPSLKFTDTRLSQIQQNITTFKQHEPTITSLKTVVDPTASWKTYSNAQYGFEFKYPNNLTVTQVQTHFIAKDALKTYKTEGPGSSEFGISVMNTNPGASFAGKVLTANNKYYAVTKDLITSESFELIVSTFKFIK